MIEIETKFYDDMYSTLTDKNGNLLFECLQNSLMCDLKIPPNTWVRQSVQVGVEVLCDWSD